MGFQGLIFGAVAACWLVYLVPMLLNRREQGAPEEVEPSEPFGSSVTIVRRGTALDAAENGSAVVSTPHNRRAALRELADRDRETAGRRRNVMIFLSLLGITTAVLAAFGLVPWWVLTVPVGLLVAFLVVARFSVARLRRELDERARIIRGGDVDEMTVAITVHESTAEDEAAQSVELSAPIERTGSLWEPIPITAPTYVSRPLAPRTVRTIDLSAPVVSKMSLPVTADGPETAPVAPAAETPASGESPDRPRAVGE